MRCYLLILDHTVFCLTQFLLFSFSFFLSLSPCLLPVGRSSEEPSHSLLCVHAWVKFRTHILPVSSTATVNLHMPVFFELLGERKPMLAACIWEEFREDFTSLSLHHKILHQSLVFGLFVHFMLLPSAPPSKILLFFFLLSFFLSLSLLSFSLTFL